MRRFFTSLMAASFLLFGVSLATVGCDSAEDNPRCKTKSKPFRICNGSELYECPVGDGSWADMTLVKDCAATGDECVFMTIFDPYCGDPNVEPDLTEEQ